MFTTAVISFREFLEAFLIIGVFFGISRKLELKKELEILLAASTGVVLSLFMTIGVYYFGDNAKSILTEKNADILESYLLIFSGLFISYVVFSLHNIVRRGRGGTLIKAHKKLQQNVFDISLFFTIVFLVLREGFEIALFTASVSLFSAFIQNVLGLILGFVSAIILGISTFFAYLRMPIGKIFKATEYMIVLLGAALTQNGITALLETHFNIHLSQILSFHLLFLPENHSLVGNLLKGFLGIDRDFSMARFLIMFIYCLVIYTIFIKQKKVSFIETK